MEVWQQEYHSKLKKYEHYIFQVFRIVCIIIALWMSVDLIIRYFDNKDKASVSYKRFHDSSLDRYPTYTLCFKIEKRPEGIAKIEPTNFYKDSYLKQFNLTKLDYLSILWGDVSHGKANSNLEMMYNKTDLSKIDFERAAKHPMDAISDYLVGYNSGKHTKLERRNMPAIEIVRNRSWFNPEDVNLNNTAWPKLLIDQRSEQNFSNVFPFYKTYQDDEQICLTRRDEFRNKVTLNFEHMTYWMWKKDYFDRIAIYIHHPGQGMRQFFQFFLSKVLTDRICLFCGFKLQNIMKISVNQVSILRKRSDGQQPCDPYHVDDEKMWSSIFRIIPCVPPYWKIFRPKNSHKKECKTGFDIQEALKVVRETQWGDETPHIDPPCDKMKTIANIERGYTNKAFRGKLMLLNFHYVSEDYQEIVNVRDFGVEDFWSSVGGVLGMFLGYSCLQLAEITMNRIYSARQSFFIK